MLHLLVVTGLSGAGRSTALRVLEDLGYFCCDNIPPALAPQLVQMLVDASRSSSPDPQPSLAVQAAESNPSKANLPTKSTRPAEQVLGRIGLGIDVRTGAFLMGATSMLDTFERAGHEVEVVFLESSDGALVQRFSETRRSHPLAPRGDLLGAIQRERERLAPLRMRARQVLDTTRMSVHDLRRCLVEHVSRTRVHFRMVTRVVSFGFKYGLPVDADLVFDLRYLPNPHFVPELRPRSGLDPPVARFVLESAETVELLEDLTQLLGKILPRYEREGKAYLTIAIGCTGGRHRSVAVAEELARRLRTDREVRVEHRDAARPER